jgi:acyl-coenzyme A thioesterase PaaI-like protein
MVLADTAMVLACSAAWNGYRPMASIDQTTHFLRPAMWWRMLAWCGSAAIPASAG